MRGPHTMKFLAIAILGLSCARQVHAADEAPARPPSADTGYKIDCAIRVAKDPCSKACWELWGEAQKQDLEKRCAAQKKSAAGGDTKAAQ